MPAGDASVRSLKAAFADTLAVLLFGPRGTIIGFDEVEFFGEKFSLSYFFDKPLSCSSKSWPFSPMVAISPDTALGEISCTPDAEVGRILAISHYYWKYPWAHGMGDYYRDSPRILKYLMNAALNFETSFAGTLYYQ